ncbi:MULTISPECIES: BMP family ABC transporter substrate-binding protein [Bacillaceae]|uniref:BMP family ABC transporter substrate-binding protein n=1 Tax=Bacillaceae TaxID=186817 RepID=UPI001C5761D5|nr:BMP family ABC transporter substrate-binding protein [Rossellomorea sp. YZS02]MBW3111970.1 BMP family ABC transporter substrate-binding protein [Bacillus sp. MCCB 382]MDX8346092.1 BMP family ABC transporter substrate-binding protein [Rossellomorea sp. YZS02]
MRKIIFAFFLVVLIGLSGCSGGNNVEIEKVGLLVPEAVNDGVWGTKGYKGLLKIQSDYNADVFYKEGMKNDTSIQQAVEEYDEKGVTLVFGHGSEYAEVFNNMSGEHPDIHFVSFNGNATEKNTTSLQFKGYAMGFFGGMTAAFHSKTNKVGVIAAFDWQPEVQGFIDGANYQNSDTELEVKYINHWDDEAAALQELDRMIKEDIDVVYPAGDGYNVAVIEKLKEKGLFAIGYVSDQSDLGESTVLTSTVQHADKLYEIVAERYAGDKLKSGNLEFDFEDGVISMGKFSPVIPEDFQAEMKQHIKNYIETGKLPNGKESKQ